jgi:glycosyltransferase involved in cell wall biosynthesis
MLFSIVTVVFNGAAVLQPTIDSVARQRFRDFEYVVLDGASRDGTIEVLERNREHIHHCTSEPDSGIYDAWNKALRVARGEWIAFLGAGDTYYPDALEHYAAAIAAASPEAKLQYLSSRVELFKEGKRVRTIGSPWSWPAFSRRMTVAHVGSMHHRSLFAEYGQYDTSYTACADYELLLRPRNRLRAGFIAATTARMPLGGLSNANVGRALAEQERAKRTAGGRSAWLCSLERTSARVRDRVRSLIWY